MSTIDPVGFFGSLLNAGAILSGFCGTFLAFRIQREANYYRQPVADYRDGKAKDVYVGLTHFTSSFFLLILATAVAVAFGFVLPILALWGADRIRARPGLVIGGVFAAVLLLAAYFLDELIHYQVISKRLAGDAREWRREWWVVAFGVLSSVAVIYYCGFAQ